MMSYDVDTKSTQWEDPRKKTVEKQKGSSVSLINCLVGVVSIFCKCVNTFCLLVVIVYLFVCLFNRLCQLMTETIRGSMKLSRRTYKPKNL